MPKFIPKLFNYPNYSPWFLVPCRCRFLRNKDRQLNKEKYPHLNHPEVYLLHGGYKAFYYSYKVQHNYTFIGLLLLLLLLLWLSLMSVSITTTTTTMMIMMIMGFFSATLRASIICAYVTQGACQRSAGLSEEVQILDRRRKETVRLNEYTDLTTGFCNSYSFKTVFQSHWMYIMLKYGISIVLYRRFLGKKSFTLHLLRGPQ